MLHAVSHVAKNEGAVPQNFHGTSGIDLFSNSDTGHNKIVEQINYGSYG
jgi:hypothetical protein